VSSALLPAAAAGVSPDAEIKDVFRENWPASLPHRLFLCCCKKSWCSWWSVHKANWKETQMENGCIKSGAASRICMRLSISPPRPQCARYISRSRHLSLFTQKTVTDEVISLMHVCVRTCVYTILMPPHVAAPMNYKFHTRRTHNERALLLAGCERIRQFAAPPSALSDWKLISASTHAGACDCFWPKDLLEIVFRLIRCNFLANRETCDRNLALFARLRIS